MVMERPTVGYRVFSEAFLGLRNVQMRRRPFLIYQLVCFVITSVLFFILVSFYETLSSGSLWSLLFLLLVAIATLWVSRNTLAKRLRDIGMKYAWPLSLVFYWLEYKVIHFMDGILWDSVFSILLILAIGAIPSNYARRHQQHQ